jgi:L-ribulose-5-phosphate 3-epimerase
VSIRQAGGSDICPNTNWPAVMKALDNAGYTAWAISEQPGNQAADVETARDMTQRMDRIFAL